VQNCSRDFTSSRMGSGSSVASELRRVRQDGCRGPGGNAEDPTSPYFHHLDTAHIGALGHSEGGASTCIAAADPRVSAIATVSGTRPLTGLHTPALLICGGQDTVVSCDSVADTFNGVVDQPAIFMNNLAADHGSWLGQNGSAGPDFFALRRRSRAGANRAAS
jgi:hypothetical protein